METVLTPRFNQLGENLDDGKIPTMPDVMFASPGIRAERGRELTSIVAPQAPIDWLHEGGSTSSPPSSIASSLPGNKQKNKQSINQSINKSILGAHD